MASTRERLKALAAEARVLVDKQHKTREELARLNVVMVQGEQLKTIVEHEDLVSGFTGSVSSVISGRTGVKDNEGFAPGVGRITAGALKKTWDTATKGGNIPSGSAYKVPMSGSKDLDGDSNARIEPVFHDPEDYLDPMKPLFLTDIVPAKVITGTNSFEYRRQSVRDNRAAVVPDGGTKPVSKYNLEIRTGELDTIAHMSDDIKTRVLADEVGLTTWLSSEMANGLALASEAELMAVILADMEVLSQGFVTDEFTSLRKGLTKLQKQYVRPDFLAVGYDTAEALDLARYTGGDEHFVLDGPRAAGPTGQLWSTTLVINDAVPANLAIIGSSAAGLRRFVNGFASWMLDPYTGFSENLVRSRLESREKSVVVRPFALCVVALTVGS
jgi:hypothetical protein